MSYLKNWVCAAALLALCAPALAINKCTGPDGKVTFQDAACQGKAETLNVRPTTGQSGNAAAPVPDWKSKAAEVDKRLAIHSAVERREAVVGMNSEQLQQAMGLPNRVNTGEYKTGSTQQRIYERSGTTWYVYTDGQFVTAVQTSATAGASPQPTRCPSGLEIRNAETSASSMLLSESERSARQRQIGEMRNCGK